jgi:threonine dehydrogenase-like Zn-dependent dehydrogenase
VKFPDSGKRLAVVQELTSGHLGDVVIEATGRPEAVTEYTDNGDVPLNPHHMINRKHLTVKGCWGSDFSHFYRGVQFMNKHAASFPWHLVVSQVFDLQDAHKALAAVERLEVFKALLKPM